jgi:hypothetical protein
MKVKKQGLPNISGFFFRIGWLCLSYSPAGKETNPRSAATTSSLMNKEKKLSHEAAFFGWARFLWGLLSDNSTVSDSQARYPKTGAAPHGNGSCFY